MVLSSEELQLAHQVLSGLQNATGYSYATMVHGTQIVSLLQTITITTAVIVAIIFAVVAYTKSERNNVESACTAFAIAGFITLVIMAMLTSSIQGYIIPEYTVMNRVLDAVTSK